jgi:hypothetical protein
MSAERLHSLSFPLWNKIKNRTLNVHNHMEALKYFYN